MMLSTLAILTAAPLAIADAVAPAPASDRWEGCSVQLETAGAESQSLMDIYESKKLMDMNGGKASVLDALIDLASDEVKEVLEAFDQSGEGFTLMLPANMAKNYSNPNGPEVSIMDLEEFPDVNTTTMDEADAILKAHVIPNTLNYAELEELAKDAGDDGYVVESLAGYEWTWKWVENTGSTGNGNGNNGGGYIALVDTLNITGSDDGYVEINNDISLYDACPNRVVLMKGYIVPYSELEDLVVEAPAPAPAEAGTAGDSPLGPSTDTGTRSPETAESNGASGSFGAAAAAAAAVLAGAALL